MSMGGNCNGNAVVESLHDNIGQKFIHRNVWPTRAEAKAASADYIECLYNPRRTHSTLSCLGPRTNSNAKIPRESRPNQQRVRSCGASSSTPERPWDDSTGRCEPAPEFSWPLLPGLVWYASDRESAGQRRRSRPQ